MYTTCPNCTRQYHIRAEQLAMASGVVQCGYCDEQFNALDHLTDEPLVRTESGSQTEADETLKAEESYDEILNADFQIDVTDEEPQFEIPQTENKNKSTSDTEFELQPEIDLSRIVSVEEVVDELPEVLLEETSTPKSRKGMIFLSIGVLLLIAIVSAQIIWFNRDYLLQRYPDLMPWAKQFCERVNCQLIRHRDISAIRLINRDVRLHPVYKETLLVNATMSNQSHIIQPYPRIRLTLFDTNGGMVAFREFDPGEYLDESIIIKNGMIPDQPVHFVLEVTSPAKGAVSFEFRFL